MREARPPRPANEAKTATLTAALRETRARTHRLTHDLSPRQFMGPMRPTVNPVLWEIGHVGWFHEYWTLRRVHGEVPFLIGADRLFDSSSVAHATRWTLDLPDSTAVFGFLANVLERQLQRLKRGIEAPADYFYDLSICHEDMHVEALIYTRQTLGYPRPKDLGNALSSAAQGWPGDTDIPGGRWSLGSTADQGFVFDNEKWAHTIELAPFRIARAPVTNIEFISFIDAGGYQAREFWCDDGWAWREREGANKPVYWLGKTDGVWSWRRYGDIEPLRPNVPVVFINWYEAQAWCRWAGRRLPTEAEWEVAAIGEPTASGRLAETKRCWPWGDQPPDETRANLDFASDEPLPVDAYPAGDTAFGCRQMTGNIWEWTASDFVPFPGFAPDPYTDYSQPWFGSRKVLRGGSWATSKRIGRPGYRNFFTPERNDLVAGFRTCAL